VVLHWGRGALPPPNLSLAPQICLQQQYAVVKPANSYTGGHVLEGWNGSFGTFGLCFKGNDEKRSSAFCLAPPHNIFF